MFVGGSSFDGRAKASPAVPTWKYPGCVGQKVWKSDDWKAPGGLPLWISASAGWWQKWR